MKLQSMPGHLIRRMQQRHARIFKQRMHEAGIDITSVQFAALVALRHQPGIEQTRIAAAIGYDKATIGGVVDRLVHKGLVERTACETDKRANAVNLTPLGRTTVDASEPVVVNLQPEFLAQLDPVERRELSRLLSKALAIDRTM